MMDVSQGSTRARSWPTKRGSTIHPNTLAQMERFRLWQLACKYMAPGMLKLSQEATKGTPLLPRDILTMLLAQRFCAIILPDGKVRYPMPFRNDVSQSLDAIGNNVGFMLIRGAQWWEAIPYVPPSGVQGPARYHRSTGQNNVTGDNTQYQVPYDVVDDAQAYLSLHATSGQMTVNEEGIYMFTANAVYTGGSTQDGGIQGLTVNGTAVAQMGFDSTNQATWRLTCQTVQRLDVGDLVTVYSTIYGGSKVCDLSNHTLDTYIEITKLG